MGVMFKQFFFTAILVATTQAQPDRFGTPACEAPNQLARRTAFTICFSPENRVALWTIYELLAEHLNAASPRPTHFRRDSDLPDSATNSDYRGSRYQRGHLVPAADLNWSPEALADSFLLSNAAPQLPRVNLSAMRRVENEIRRTAAASEAVYVITGTLFDCGTEIAHIGNSHVTVPCAFYKAVLSVKSCIITAQASIIPNESLAIMRTVPVDELERRTGLRFFAPVISPDRPRSQSCLDVLPSF